MSVLKLTALRLAFPVLFVAKAVNEGDEPRFGASLLIDPSTPAGKKTIATVDAEIERVAKEKWGAKTPPILAQMRKLEKVCLRDGNLKAQYAGFSDMMYISAGNKMRPVVVNRDGTPLTAQDGIIYAGCHVNAHIELWAQDHPKGGKRVNASLIGVQFVRDGDRFSGGSVGSAEDFEDLGEGIEDEETDPLL